LVQSQTVLRIGDGLLVLEVPLTPATGSQVTLVPAGPPLPPAPTPLPSRAAGARDERWAGLKDAIERVAKGEGEVAARLNPMVPPRVDKALAASLRHLFRALGRGDMDAWLGVGVSEAITRIRPDLARALAQDFDAAASSLRENGTQDWRVLTLPILVDGQIERFSWYLRGGPRHSQRQTDDGGNECRFVVEIALSRIGRIQIDGYFAEQARSLQVIVRSERILPVTLEGDLHRLFDTLFADGGELAGFAARLDFRSGADSLIDPRPGAAGPGPGILV
jgi:hypothetical protein